MKRLSILPIAALFILLGAQVTFSGPFDFGKILKEITPPKKPEKPAEKTEPPPAPASSQNQSQGQPGLLDLGGPLLGLDSKTTGRIKQGLQGLQQLQPLTFEEEKEIGGSLAVEVFNRYGGAYPDARLTRYVNLVGKSVAELSDRPDIEYHFGIVNTPYPNAFATPGGYVMVSIGLLQMLKNEAQLAGVLGHEIAHISRKHALSSIEENRKLQGIGSIATAASGKQLEVLDQIIGFASNLIFETGLDPKLEYEADRYGTEFAYRLGYNPNGLRESLKILGTSQKRTGSIFSKTHPSFESRYKTLTQAIQRYDAKSGLFPVLETRFHSYFPTQP
ncbi:MAG: peptidase M48 [Nitrospinae bacterium CG11_big_fil_rev_8_21_14_0_20_56_8]|nr:MAG: peptidase M48 [Nitrospinae bacterium CG11_big_fil_rev_8_21_14_0_20_56_8]